MTVRNRRFVKQQRFAVRVSPEALSLAEKIAKANGMYGVSRAEVLANWVEFGANQAAKRWAERDGGPINPPAAELAAQRARQQEENSVAIHLAPGSGGVVECGGCQKGVMRSLTWRRQDNGGGLSTAMCIYCASPLDYAMFDEARNYKERRS